MSRRIVVGPSDARRGPEGARDHRQHDSPDEVGRGAGADAGGQRDPGHDAAERRADELVGRQLHRVQAAVGPLQQRVVVDDVGQDRLGRGVEERLADAESECRGVQHPQLLVPRGDDGGRARRATRTRPQLTRIIVARRSRRSASAPAGSATSSQGRRPTRVTVANAAGSLVTLSATSGMTVCRAPSARLDAADDAKAAEVAEGVTD